MKGKISVSVSIVLSIALAVSMLSVIGVASAQTPQTISQCSVDNSCNALCIGQATEFLLSIENTGSEDDTYVILPSDSSWVAVADSVFVEAGSSKNVVVTVIPKKSGNNIFELSIIGSKEAPKVLKRTVIATECRDVTVIASPSEVVVCQRTPAMFDIIIKNKGQIADTFDLQASAGALEETKVVLEPDESRTIKLVVETENLQAEKDIVVSASSGNVIDTETITVRPKNCYSAKLDILPKEKTVCPCTSVDYQIMLKNTGELGDEYLLTIADVVQTISLDPDESRLFNFSIPLIYGTGVSAIVTTAESDHVYLEDTGSLTVRPSSECFTAELLGEEKVEIEKCSAQAIPIQIKNTGERAQIFRLYVDGPDWLYLSKDDAYVNAGEEKEVYVYVSPPYETETGIYPVTINSTSIYSHNVIEFEISVIPNKSKESSVSLLPDESTDGTGDDNQTDGQNPPDDLFGFGGTGNGSNGITGVITLGSAPLWKTIVVAIITIIIVSILVVRFAVLVKK